MRRGLQLFNNIITYSVLAFVLIAGVAGSLTGKPLLLTSVRSESMLPTYKRGDLVFLWPVGPNTELRVGDVLVFKLEAGSLSSAGWVIHRAVEGDAQQGFITQGDNNDTPDQHRQSNPPVMPENVAARALFIGNVPLKIPLIGYLPIWAERAIDQPYLLPGIAVLLMMVAFASHMTNRPPQRRRRRRRSSSSSAAIFILGGLSVFILTGAAGLMLSQHYSFQYSVSAEGRAVVMGNSMGQLMVGDEVTRTLGTVENKRGRLPLVLAINSNNPQITLNHEGGVLAPGEEIKLSMTIKATEAGDYPTHIWVGLFYPILPADIILSLAETSYWLALSVVSLIPAMPILLIPVLDESLRMDLVQSINKRLRRLRLPV